MKLLPTYALSDAGNIVKDGYFDPATRVRYAVREGQADKGDAAEIRWGTVWTVVAYVTPDDDAVPMAHLSRDFATVEEALAELDRIAALIDDPAPAPAQEWVKGSPPKDGQWYVVMHATGSPVAIRYCGDPGLALFRNLIEIDSEPWCDASGATAATSTFTHHLPTPIQPPKES